MGDSRGEAGSGFEGPVHHELLLHPVGADGGDGGEDGERGWQRDLDLPVIDSGRALGLEQGAE